MASKYAVLKDKFPLMQLDANESSTQRIFKLRRELDGMTRKEVQELFKKLRYERDALKAAESENYERLSAAQMWLLDWADEEDVQSWKDDDGFSYRDQPDVQCYVEDKKAFDDWAEAHGWRELYTINFQTLNAQVKPLLLENAAPPPGVGVYMRRKIVLTKPK